MSLNHRSYLVVKRTEGDSAILKTCAGYWRHRSCQSILVDITYCEGQGLSFVLISWFYPSLEPLFHVVGKQTLWHFTPQRQLSGLARIPISLHDTEQKFEQADKCFRLWSMICLSKDQVKGGNNLKLLIQIMLQVIIAFKTRGQCIINTSPLGLALIDLIENNLWQHKSAILAICLQMPYGICLCQW